MFTENISRDNIPKRRLSLDSTDSLHGRQAEADLSVFQRSVNDGSKQLIVLIWASVCVCRWVIQMIADFVQNVCCERQE
jgi:hypothetical protein